ncbi:MAG: hypothetical protein FWF15_05345, partial [Oscillospiraceae bacterium]|nr:hypothetical protein [Oscillospiraceae bacterium]
MNMNTLKIGWASRDISTDKPINIPGQFHMRISQGITDPLTANVLLIENGSDIVVFVSIDAVVVRSHLLDELRAKVFSYTKEIPVEKIILNATHTHTGASHYDDSGWWNELNDIPDSGLKIASSEAYRAFLSTQIAEAILEAYQTRKEGGIAYGYGYAVVGHSRRVVYFDDTSKRAGGVVNGYMVNGHGVMYGNTADDNFSHYEAGTDSFVNVMFTFDSTNNLTGAVVNIPCPSQNSEHDVKLSADYWHNIRSAIREKFGDIYILGQCAAGGDLSPRVLHYKQAQERRFKLKYGGTDRKDFDERKDIGERVACAFAEIYGWAKNDIQTELPITHVVETVNLSKRIITDEELDFCTAQLKKLEDRQFSTDTSNPIAMLNHNSALQAERSRYKEILKRYEEQTTNPKLPMELHILRIGDISFATNRFELYMDFMHRIQA